MRTIQDMLDCPHANPKIAEAEHDYVRALQRYEASQRACREMFGSLSILVVPRADHQALAEAGWEVERARLRLGQIQRARGEALLSGLRYSALTLTT